MSDAESDIEIEIDDDSHYTAQKIPKNEFPASDNESKNENHLNLPNCTNLTLENMIMPTEELIIQDDNISDLEKTLNPDYFKGFFIEYPLLYIKIFY